VVGGCFVVAPVVASDRDLRALAAIVSERRHPVPRLTPRQTGLLQLVAAGRTNAQIARRLGISEGTVRTHLENIYERLHVSSRTAAVTRAFPDRVA
jgi:DNA-binding NarL/FixJ family response regulator